MLSGGIGESTRYLSGRCEVPLNAGPQDTSFVFEKTRRLRFPSSLITRRMDRKGARYSQDGGQSHSESRTHRQDQIRGTATTGAKWRGTLCALTSRRSSLCRSGRYSFEHKSRGG